MKVIIMGLSLMFSGMTLAKQVELKISSLYKKGDVTTKMNEVIIQAILGKEFTVPASNENPFKMNLNISEFKEPINEKLDPTKSVMVKGHVSMLDNGKMKKVASPKVITVYGEEAIISIQSGSDNSFFQMKIKPSESL